MMRPRSSTALDTALDMALDTALDTHVVHDGSVTVVDVEATATVAPPVQMSRNHYRR